MKILFFDTHRFERPVFEKANQRALHEISFVEARLDAETAELARGYPAVCAFVNDRVDREVLGILAQGETRLVALRSAGFNQVDLEAAAELGITVVRVPAYSPHAVAEHATCLALALNRKVHRAFNRVREANFSLDGLVGFDFNGKTVGVIGTGKIGTVFARIMRGFGCDVLAHDLNPDRSLVDAGLLRYVSLEELYRRSDVISLHLPLKPGTRHLIGCEAIAAMKPGVMLINTGRGALIETPALIEGLKSGKIGSAGLDVYEEEEKLFFQDLSDQVLQDDVLARLMTLPNVIITAHQAFLTREALEQIATTTLQNVSDFEAGRRLENEVCAEVHVVSGQG